MSYCVKRGSPVYTCSLDAEGAFDAIPHDILFRKAMNVISDHCWMMLVNWYRAISVRIKWGSEISEPIAVRKGTRQGGLTSPFLFNLFYEDLINQLSDCIGGININDHSFNVFCYADDLLLTSLTVSGLQKMICVANKYIRDNGLKFNPLKTECVIFGKCTLDPHPEWTLNGVKLDESTGISYLGVTLSHSKPNEHVEKRISACRRAYYALQGAGFGNDVTNVDALAYVWNSAIRPVLTYGINCINISKTCLAKMEKLQTRLLKTGVGLHKYCRSSPVIKALNVKKIETTMDISTLDLVRSMLCNNSRARLFYMYIMNMQICGKLAGHTNLLSRVQETCMKYNVSFLRYVLDKSYANKVKSDIRKQYCEPDGLTDSVRQLLISRDPYDRRLLNMLLKSF